MFKRVKRLLGFGIRAIRSLGYFFLKVGSKIIINKYTQINMYNIDFTIILIFFSFDDQSSLEFNSVDIVCKQIKQCNENLTADINLER